MTPAAATLSSIVLLLVLLACVLWRKSPRHPDDAGETRWQDYHFQTPPDSLPARDPVVEANRRLLLERSEVGIGKYGTMLDRDDLDLEDWLQHLLEEQLDAVNYTQAALFKLRRDRQARCRHSWERGGPGEHECRLCGAHQMEVAQ